MAEAIAALGDKLDRAAGGYNFTLLEDLTRDVSIRLDALEVKIEDRARDGSSSENWPISNRRCATSAAGLGDMRAAADTRTLEQEVRLLHDKLDDVADARALPDAFVEQAAQALARDVGARISAATPDALIGHLPDIHERLDVIGSVRAAPAALEQALRELTEELEALRTSRDLVDRGVTTLSDMRAEQAQIDRRMDARFSGVQDVLEKLVDRLGRLEREIVSEGGPRPPAPTGRPLAAPTPGRAALVDIPERGAESSRAQAEADPLAAEIAARAARRRRGGERQSRRRSTPISPPRAAPPTPPPWRPSGASRAKRPAKSRVGSRLRAARADAVQAASAAGPAQRGRRA